jgi:hypothetical protein
MTYNVRLRNIIKQGGIGLEGFVTCTLCQHISTKMPHTYAQLPPHISSPVPNITPVLLSTRPAPTTSHQELKVPAPLLEPPFRQRLREHAVVQQLKHIPLARTTLSLEVPEDPPARLGLVRIQLHFDIAANLVLPVLGPRGDGAGFASAGADVVRVCVASFHAGALVEAVQVGRAVSEGTGPFADN